MKGVIGHALAQEFQLRDFRVFASARELSKLGALAKLRNVIPVRLNVVNPEPIAAAKELVAKEADADGLTHLINNAACNHFMPILDEDIDECKRVFDTNVWGPLAIKKAFAPLLIKAKGKIVSITSISGHVNVPWMGKESLIPESCH